MHFMGKVKEQQTDKVHYSQSDWHSGYTPHGFKKISERVWRWAIDDSSLDLHS
jgi:hypothetical protein